jgi:hypothetical protein
LAAFQWQQIPTPNRKLRKISSAYTNSIVLNRVQTMKLARFAFFAVILFTLPLTASAQKGGIGINPREDMVRLRATTQDSFATVVSEQIAELKKLITEGKMEEAQKLVAHNGGTAKTEKWARPVMMSNTDEGTRTSALLDKLGKLFATFPNMDKKYYAVFKDADNPAGQKHLYQIEFSDGKRKQMVSFNFYPIGEKMLLGDVQ